MKVGGTYKSYETAHKAAKTLRKTGAKVDIKELTKGFGVYKYPK